MKNLPGEVPGFNFMPDTYNINISELSINVYKYPIKHSNTKNQYIPIFVINIPWGSASYDRNIKINGFSKITASDFGIDYDLPFWGINNTSPYVFLEIYQDDYFHISTTIYRDTPIITVANYLNGTLLYSGRGFNYASNYVHSVAFKVVKYSDGVYAPLSWGDSTGDTIQSYTTNIIKNIESGVSKGLIRSSDFILFNYNSLNTQASFVSNTNNQYIHEVLNKSLLYDPNDPNNSSGNSGGGGGGGSNDIGGDEHSGGTTPTISALDSGLMTLYNPTVTELQSLGKFLWSDSFDVNTFKKLFNDPFDTLLGLSIIPIKPNISGTHNIIFGNLDSGVSSSVVANQWISVDCGSLNLSEVWNGSLDYSPWTQVSIYLPFIGVKQLNTNDVMGSTLSLKYSFDVLSGACIAEISINHNLQGNKDSGFSYNANMGCVYTFEGQCATNIPLASMDFTNTIRAAISAVSIGVGGIASIATGNPALGLASIGIGMTNTGIQANTPTVERSGQLSGSNSIMASLQPCLFVSRPHICKPEKYYALRGVPSQVYVSDLSKCTGYFQIADVHNIHASGATDSELDQIKSLLTQGVFVTTWPTKTVTKEDSVKLTLYNNKSSKNTIDKNISAVRDDNILDGVFRDSCDIENPVIRIKLNDVSSINNLNYMYIGIFQRYYYITKITSMRNHIVEITGHVDVLKTYGYEIGQNTGIIARSSQVPSYGNTYLDDNLLATYQDTYNVAYNWGYSFSHDNDNLILAVAGALQS